jgi:hypothetical protein
MRMTRWLVAGFGMFVMSTVAQANIIVDSGEEYFTLVGKEVAELPGAQLKHVALLYAGPASGSVNQIDLSFFFSPATEGGQAGFSFPSDFALIVTAPGKAPQQWGGRDTTYAGATRVADWNPARIPQAGGDGIYDQFYSDVVTTGLGGLEGNGTWKIEIMNGLSKSEEVNYQSVRIVLHGVDEPTAVPEGAERWEHLLAVFAVVGGLGLARQRTRRV